MSEISETIDELLLLLHMKNKSGREQAISMYIEGVLREIEVEYAKQLVTRGGYNIIVNPIKKPRLVITTHMDVVDPRVIIRVDGTTIYSQGAADPLGQVILLLNFMRNHDVSEFPEVSIAFFTDEEVWGSGSNKYLEKYKPEMALILEPTGLQYATSGHGGIGITIQKTKEQSLHASLGDISQDLTLEFSKELINIANKLRKCNLRMNLIKFLCKSTSYYTTINNCTANVEIILPPRINYSEVLKKIYHIFDLHGLNNWRVDYISPSFFSKSDNKIAKALEKAFFTVTGKEIKLIEYPSWSDANNFYRAGVKDLVIFGPGEFHSAHTLYEKIDVKDIIIAEKVVYELVKMI